MSIIGEHPGTIEAVAPGEARWTTATRELSFAQRRLWFLDRLDPGTATYHLAYGVQLSGDLDLPALADSFNEIVRRHDALRTTFHEENGTPVQVIARSLTLDLPTRDLSALEPARREQEVRRVADESAQQPFDLSSGPLLRLEVLRLAAREHVLLVTMHHIVADAWSIGVLVRELAALYPAFHARLPSPLPPLPLQYADFADWQRERLSGDALRDQLDYWSARLEGMPASLALPVDRSARAAHDDGAEAALHLDRELTARLKILGRDSGASLFMVLLAAFKALLSRYSGQHDIIVGTPIANRQRMEVEPLIGFFVNTLVLRTDLSSDPSFREIVMRVRETAFDAYAHQDLPFERLVEELGPAQRSGRTPLIQVMFALQNAPAPTLELAGLRLSTLPRGGVPVKFDLTLHIHEHAGGMSGALVYRTALFSDATIRRLIQHYERLLEAAVAVPDARLSELPLLRDDEYQQVVHEWNATRHAIRRSTPVPVLVEERAREHPDDLALVCGGTCLTYGDLDDRAERLAAHLRTMGIGREARVAICVERSAEFLVGALAVWKSGGAYLPLDPAYPGDRLAFMLRDSRASLLLTRASLVETIASHGSADAVPIVCLDRELPPLIAVPQSWTKPSAASLAYVIYTSGSSGEPKSVEVTHGSLTNLVDWHRRTYRIARSDRATLLASVGFDASVWELWPYLASGAALYNVDDETRRMPSLMVEFLKANAITIAFLPTPLAEAMLREPALDATPLRTLLTGGDRLRVRPEPGQRYTVVNHYGPTEATVVATSATIAADADALDPPIGRPIANATTYVLDGDLQPVPIGAAGELYVGGDGVARGYGHRAALTAERFVPDPFSERSGARLYRTGDRARYDADGQIEFLGRFDDQVKVRGHRVEPGEIEAALCRCTGVRRAVVLPRQDSAGDTRLVAYVERVAEGAPDADVLRDALSEWLPAFMVPGTWIFPPVLPVTAHGKIDRHALAALEDGPAARPYRAPQTPLDDALATIWTEVLRLDRVSIDANFFELGGHSLLATQIVSRVRKTLGFELPLRSLFEEPTVEGLARGIEAKRWESKVQPRPPLTAAARSGDGPQVFPQSFAQRRLWFVDKLDPRSSSYNVPKAVRLSGVLDVAALDASVNELVRRHEALRTTFALQDGQLAQIVAPYAPVHLAVSRLDVLPADERPRHLHSLMNEDAQRPFDLTRGPLLRVSLVRLAEQEHVLLLTMHHIITDAWSVGVLARELSALYGAFRDGTPSPLSPLSVQYADFSQWQLEWLQFGVLEALLFYWQERIKGAPPVLALQTDRPRSPAQTTRGATIAFRLDRALTDRLGHVGRDCGASLFMVLLAGFKALLARYTGQPDIIVGTPIANRHYEELESLVGFFVNTLVMRTDLSGAPSFREAIGRVRATALGAYAHQDLPFERLVEELGPEHRWTRAPLVQVMFVLQNVVMPALELPGLRASVVPLASETARFDLTCELAEDADGLSGRVTYSTDLFDEPTIQRLVAHYQRLLDAATGNPDASLSTIALLEPDEIEPLVRGWNGAVQDWQDSPSDLVSVFEAQADRTPTAAAVVDDRKTLTYADLDARANRLAHHLIARGVQRESRVGICLERSTGAMVAVLGILKAGGAYLPLDPSYPAERLAFMMNDGEVAVLLTDRACANRLPSLDGRTVIVDDEAATIAACPTGRPRRGVAPDNLAYVIYTSGSTGWPKGVQCSHRSVVNVLRDIERRLPGRDGDRRSSWSSLSFDVSIYEVFGSLLFGGTLQFVPDALRADAWEMSRWLADHAIESAYLPPSMIGPLGEWAGQHPGRLALRRLLVGVEPIDDRLLAALKARVPDLRILNGYGPTETTLCATVYDVGDTPARGRPTPIGGAVANDRVFVVDGHHQLTPIGVPGELLIGGAGVARGYLGRPAATAERFVPDGCSGDAGARLYRSGDRVRYVAPGVLEFLGRVDDQVKVRGYRIEPGEIERVLGEVHGVRRAVVVARAETAGDNRLVAYLEQEPGAALAVDDVRAKLKRQLPDFMVPSAFVFVAALPQTPHGKVDRAALPAPETIQSEPDASRPPADALEARLAETWARLLRVESVGVRQNFFELGGHSLLALNLQSELRKTLDVEFPLSALFEDATIEHLADVIRRDSPAAVDVAGAQPKRRTTGGAATRATPRLVRRLRDAFTVFTRTRSLQTVSRHTAGADDVLVPIQTQGRGSPFYCVHPIGGSVLCYAELARQLGSDRPFYGLQAADAGETSIEAMAARYVDAIRTVQAEGPYLLGGWSMGGLIAYEMAHALRTQGQETALLALVDSFPPVSSNGNGHIDERHLFDAFVADLAAVPGIRLPASEDVQSLTADGRLDRALDRLKRAHILAEEIDAPQFERMWQRYGANYRALAAYVPAPQSGRLTVIMAAESDATAHRTPIATWGPLAGGGLSIDVLPGDHYSLLRHPTVRLTAGTLAAFLRSTDALVTQ